MSPPRFEKLREERVRECITILKKITDELEIPDSNPSVQLLKKRMRAYWEDGKTQEDRIPLVGSNRYIMYRFPRWSHQQVEVILRAGLITHHELSKDLLADLEAQTSSVPQSGP